MYYSDISSDELRIFHKMQGVDFSISLTDLLNSDLFKVETIIENELYRVYPLFYCDNITSSNPDDKILDTRCLILLKNEHETFLSFRTNKDNPNNIIDDEYLNIKDIGDSLTINEFNALVYRLRKNTVLNEVLNFSKVNHHVKDTDISTTMGLTGIFESDNIKSIKISGKSVKTLDNTPVKNKTFHLYYYTGSDWKFIKSIDTNNKGEYTYIDYSITDFIDDSLVGTRDELQDLIDTAIENNQSEIVLDKQYKFTSRNPIVIDGSIQINGNGHIIDGDNKSRLFKITGDDVTLTNLILLNANSGTDDGNGGAVQWTGANGELNNTVIAHSIANTKGGGVYWTGATGKIRNIRFIHNATNGDGGALYVDSDKFQAIGVISYNNYSNGDGGCTYATGDYLYFENWIISKDTTNGGTHGTFKVIGDYATVKGFNVSNVYYNQNFTDYTTHAVDGQIKYMLLPSTWILDNTDFSVFNTYDLIYHASTSSKGEDKGIISLESDYCEYKFYNADNRLSNNSGLIINDNLKDNPVTVKLDNPLFEYANYYLTCTVRSVTGANIFDDDNDDYIVEDSFNIRLIEDEEIPIDVSNYSNDSVLLFNIESSIDFNVPEIVFPETLKLSSDKSSVDINEPVILSCKYTDTKNNPVVNALIRFKVDDTVVGQAYTNNNGMASFTYTPTTGGEHSISAEHNELQSNSIIIDVISFDGISLTSDKNILSKADNEYATLTAQLTNDGSPVSVSGETVSFEVRKVSDDSLVESLTGTTDASGVASVDYYGKGTGDLYIVASVSNITSNSISIEDCQYYNTTEKTYTGTNNHQLYDSNLSIDFANKQEISFDAKVQTTSSVKDYRYWVFPKSQYNGMTYPSCGLFIDKKPNAIKFGKMENGENIPIGTFNTSSNTYVRVKYIINGTTVQLYADDVLLSTSSLSCISNYSDWTISVMTWSGSETRCIKNVKFKPL